MPRLITPAEVLAEPLPPVRWLVEPIITQESRVLVFGESGSMKSWLLLSLGLHLAAGRAWLAEGAPGGVGYAVTRPYRVLYVDEEMPADDTWERVWKLCKGHGIPADVPFAVVNRAHFRAKSPLDAKVLCDWVQKACADRGSVAWPPEVVIVETMRQVMVGSENDSGNVTDLWANLAPLSDGRTLLLSHHMTKPSDLDPVRQRSKYRARGSGRQIDHPDTALALSRPQPEHPLVLVEHVKARRRREGATFAVELVHPAGDEGPAFFRRADEQMARLLTPAGPLRGAALPYPTFAAQAATQAAAATAPTTTPPAA